jgi:hypothetical protein
MTPFHLQNLDMAGPAAQDRMRAVKARLLECLPSCRTFLDVDGKVVGGKPETGKPLRSARGSGRIRFALVLVRADLKSGNGMSELDKSRCILVFCTAPYFEKRNSLRELYRAICQGKYMLAMLEPDVAQQGGLNKTDVEALITDDKLNQFHVSC